MQTKKIFNYVTGIVAIIHAGVTSQLMQEIFMIPNFPSDFESYEQIRRFAETLPDSYVTAMALFFLSGACLFILGVVTLVLNMRLDNTVRIKRLAVGTSAATLLGVFVSIMPLINIIYPILLSIFYIVAGYFMPLKK